MDRREFIRGMTAVAATAALPLQDAVPNSSGVERPSIDIPHGACDCHHHIYDASRFPPPDRAAHMMENARVADYRALQRRLGLTRNVIVTPAPYVGDNRVTVDALRQFGANARAVALLRPDVAEAELKALNDAGVRGARISLGNPGLGNPSTIDMLGPLAKRVAPLGWHIQVFMRADQIVAWEALLTRLPTPMVMDHMGILLPQGVQHPAFAILQRLVDSGRTWVKLSAPSQQAKPDGKGGFAASYDGDLTTASRVARAFVLAAPERMLWGSNWPHPGEDSGRLNKPDDAAVLDLLRDWAPDASVRRRILVENPAQVYGFPES